MMILVPTNREKTTEENQNNPQGKKRRVQTCVWMDEEDLEKFQSIPELKRMKSKLTREFLHNYLSSNGYSSMNLAREIEKEHHVQRESNKRLYTLKMKQQQMIKEEYDQGRDLLEEGTVERISTNIIIDMAHDNYNRYKSVEEMSGDAKLQPGLTWIKTRMNAFKNIPGFDKKPNEIQDMILEITENKRKQWDEEYEQEQKKYLSRRRG